jgi:RNA polymerase sigma-70 factor (ECF subfamily)
MHEVAVLDTEQVVMEERGRLFGIAYRMLGTVPDAEDAVQETLIKWHQADRAQIEHPSGWLTTVITRHCIDQLRSARARRETYMGTWLPDPIVAGDTLVQADPSERVALDESLSMAMLVVLETLSPAERAVFVLHDVFGLEFDEIRRMVGRTAAACRQLASRARRHVEARRPRFDPDAEEQRRVVAAFLDASNRGDLDGMLALLDPSVVMRSEGGGKVHVARHPVRGADRVGKVLRGGFKQFAGAVGRIVAVNGGTGALISMEGRILGVVGITVAGGRITEIDAVFNPDKLQRFADS